MLFKWNQSRNGLQPSSSGEQLGKFIFYGLGTVFILTALYGIVSMLRLRHTSGHKKVVHIINFSLLSVFGFSRGLFLVIDGYHYRKMLPPIAVKLLWGVGHPCIITPYSLLFLVLKNALSMRQRFKTWYTTKNITMTALSYFMFVGIAEMTVAFIPSLKVLTFLCQLLYLLFTLLLLLFYGFVARVLCKKKRSVKTGMNEFRRRKSEGTVFQSMLVVCNMVIVGGFLLCISQLYGMAGVYGVFSNAYNVAPWPWYAFNTAQRVFELYMAILLLWILSSSSKVSSTDSNQNTSSLNDRSVEQHSTGDIIVKRHLNRENFCRKGVTTELSFPGSTMPEIHT
ncbi:uncharacterized protein LOC116302266 [Actinia tenebrosa]|uniref:Uncharacterized protein LOC116302266 n=1 Tax=Actinia tenebrosa TaxID=6105 RepID=A0A6P8IKA3_ACTTE|nr:uncharacterized protein LOC116302266 [Actinia tenebrosa]